AAGADGVKQFGRDLMALSERIPVAAEDLTKVAVAAGQFGLKEDQILPFTEMAAKVGVAIDMAAGEAAQGMAEIMSGAKMTIPEVSLLMDSINHLSNNSAASAGKIFDTVKRVAAQGKTFGFTAQQTAAFAAQMTAAGYASEVAATSFKNMGLALTQGSAATKSRRSALGQLGFTPERIAKDMQKDAVGTVLKVMKAIQKAAPEKRAALVSQVFGNEAQGIHALIGDIEGLELAMKRATDEAEYGESIQKEYANRILTTEASVQLAQNAFGNLSRAIGLTLLPALKGASEGIVPIVQAIRNFVHENEGLVRGVIMAASGLIALRVGAVAAQFAALYLKGAILQVALVALKAVRGLLMLLNPIKLVTGAMALLRGAFLLSGVGAILMAIGLAGAFIYNNWEGVSAAFAGFGEAFMAALGPAGGMLTPVIEGARQLWQWVTDLVKPLEMTGEQWKDWGKGVGKSVGALVQGNIRAFQTMWTHLKAGNWKEAFAPAMRSLSGIGQRLLAAFHSIDWAGLGSKIITSLAQSFQNITTAIQSINWMGVGEAVGRLIGDAIAGLLNLGAWLIKSISSGDGGGIGLGIAVVNALIAGLMATWGFFAGVLKGLFTNISLVDAGAALMNSLWEGMKSIGASIKAWIASLFEVNLPSWMGGGGASAAVPPAAKSGPAIQERATGGPVAAAKPYLVGERGPELFVPRVAGNIVNASETARHLTQRASAASARAGSATANARTPAGGGSGPVSVTFAGGINIQGGAAATPQQIRREFSREASLLMRRHFSDGIT
ncbi:phage tail tape measure protein, partial [Xanthobacter sp. TB0136]|uniref:phage tail tape measure protein n=1 Tax=Xanthobacter sp. TB0136 TaxID=3459177 RepID=UPI0040396866